MIATELGSMFRCGVTQRSTGLGVQQHRASIVMGPIERNLSYKPVMGSLRSRRSACLALNG